MTVIIVSRIDTVFPAMNIALGCLVEMLAKMPNSKGIIAKMIKSTIFTIIMNNASVGSINSFH
jgi:hypothetical protein